MSRLVIMVFCLCLAVRAESADVYAFDSKEEELRYSRLIEELRCPKCLNINLAGSDAPIATDLRQQVYRMLKQGHSDSEILHFMQSRYGDFILYRPRLTEATWLLWFGPLLLLIPGAVFWYRKWREFGRPEPGSEP